MLLDEVLAGLRDVSRGKAVMTPEQADNVLDAIYLLLERQKVTEENLAFYRRKAIEMNPKEEKTS